MKNRTKSIILGILAISLLSSAFTLKSFKEILSSIILSLIFGYFSYFYFNKKDKKTFKENVKTEVVSFRVKTWDEYADNIKKWQKENARNQWLNEDIPNKFVYKYSWENNIPVKFVFEKNNSHDSKAILVYINDMVIGYVPRELNVKYRKYFKNNNLALAEIRGGDRRIRFKTGQVQVENYVPIVEVTVFKGK